MSHLLYKGHSQGRHHLFSLSWSFRWFLRSYIQGSVENLRVLDARDLPQLVDQPFALLREGLDNRKNNSQALRSSMHRSNQHVRCGAHRDGVSDGLAFDSHSGWSDGQNWATSGHCTGYNNIFFAFWSIFLHCFLIKSRCYYSKWPN